MIIICILSKLRKNLFIPQFLENSIFNFLNIHKKFQFLLFNKIIYNLKLRLKISIISVLKINFALKILFSYNYRFNIKLKIFYKNTLLLFLKIKKLSQLENFYFFNLFIISIKKNSQKLF
jgi:hypothetical protein